MVGPLSEPLLKLPEFRCRGPCPDIERGSTTPSQHSDESEAAPTSPSSERGCPTSPSPGRLARGLRGIYCATQASHCSGGDETPSEHSIASFGQQPMNVRTFLQSLTPGPRRGPLRCALLDFATSVEEEERLPGNPSRLPSPAVLQEFLQVPEDKAEGLDLDLDGLEEDEEEDEDDIPEARAKSSSPHDLEAGPPATPSTPRRTRRPGAELLGVSCESTSRRRRSSVESMLGLGDSQAISGSLSVPSNLQGPLLGLVAAAEQESTSGRMPDAESQETVNYIHVAASSASTEDSTVVQDPRFFIGAPKEAKVYGEAVQEKLPIVVSHEFASSVASSCFQRRSLNIIAESKEWDALASSSESCGVGAELGEDNFGRQSTPSHIEVGVSCDADVLVDPNLLRCWSWCFFFLEMWVSNFCLCLCVARGDWGICFLLSLPHLLLVGMEVELISRDWAFRRNLFTLRRHSPLKAWFFKYIVFAVFGLLSCLPVVRARQCWKQRGMRPSLVDEIEEPSATDSARFDSHVMLVTNVPRIMVLLYASTCLLYSKLQLSILLSMAFLSLVNVLQAAVNFDYYASSWIRRQYERVSESVMFHVLHHSYRLVELALRILTLLGFAVVLRNQALLGVSLLALDYLLGTAALLVVTSLTPGSSRMVLILSVSIYVFDCCRFIDECGLTMQARYISSFLRGLRVFQSASVIPLIWFFARPGRLRTEGWEAEFLGLLSMVGTLLVAYFLLECFTRLRHRPVDVFIACRKGLLPELTALLDEGTDANRRLLDATRQTPLHIAAAAGSSACVTALLQHGADPLLCDVEDETALHKACRRGDARCIRALLHPPNDTPCVLRGDHLECTLQANKSGLIARQLLSPKADCRLAEELMACEQGEAPLVGRTCSTQMEQSIPRRPTTPVEATEIFGKVLKDSSSRFLVDETSSDNSNLTGFLFSTGVGERMAEVLGADQRFAEEQPVQLTALRTQGVLGAGAFGKVFKVLDVASSEVYALKLQRRDRASKFAIREATALHRSSHAFIVRLIHIFQTQSYYALLMELCDKSLNACILDHFSSSGRLEGLPEDLARRYAACITLALEYLHQQKVVFRDLKPDNVLVTFQDNVAKLADFGLARSLDPSFLDKGADPDSDNDEKALSPYSSTVCGTPRFMAPEVYDEPKFYDSEDEEESAIKRVLSRDWYAMGCCMLLMLLGQDGGSLAEMKGRRVLLPPSGQQEITCALRKASKKGLIHEHALHLIDALTAPVEARANAEEVRAQPFMKAAIQEMEKFAGHMADTRS